MQVLRLALVAVPNTLVCSLVPLQYMPYRPGPPANRRAGAGRGREVRRGGRAGLGPVEPSTPGHEHAQRRDQPLDQQHKKQENL